MGKLRNRRREMFAQALADGVSRGEAMISAGYPSHRGNQNRLAQSHDVVARVEEIRKHSDQVVDLRKLDHGRLLIELARIAFANVPLRAAIAAHGPEALNPDQPVLLVTIRMEGVLARPIELRLLDDRGALAALMHFGKAPGHLALDFGRAVPPDFAALEQALRRLLADRELLRNDACDAHAGPVAGAPTGSPS